MTISPYAHDEHFELVKSWLKNRGVIVPRKELFYECGYVVGGIAIGFVTKTAPAQAMIDHLVADPNASKEDRDKAIRILGEVLAAKAKEGGAKCVLALTNVATMKERMEDVGYRKFGDYTLYFKVLEEGA